MENSKQDFSSLGFVKTFVLPALLLFLVPVLALLFFLHARSTFDADAREAMLLQVREDESITEQERAETIEVIERVPFSEMLLSPEFAATIDSDIRFYYANFRWMIRLAVWSIVSGIVVLLLAGIGVLLSMRSQQAQYLSLSVSWHVLRIYGALQTIVQGVLLVALSFWVTALWAEVYYIKLIGIAALLALVAIGTVIAAIFKKPVSEFVIEGEVVDKASAPALWQNLEWICTKVGTDLPDQLIAGIDANFFVTAQPVTVADKTYTGRTLYVSLSLLKKLSGSEADAVMAHEMAHFSGDDTTFAKKISPLLIRYDNYLQALHDGVITKPIFYFMLCFRGLFELSLGRLSRQREFRADRIATEVASPKDLAAALLRIVAYSKYRNSIEEELFKQEEALEVADISERIERGFSEYVVAFSTEQDLGDLETFHPFDSHPPMQQRFEAVGLQLSGESTQALLAKEGDGRWYHNIRTAGELEQQQWDEYEERFRKFHEEVSAYRYLPENEQELAIVVQYFPEVTFEGKEGLFTLNYERFHLANWPEPLLWSQITGCSLNDNGVLEIVFSGSESGKKKHKLKLKKFTSSQQEVIDTFNRYYSRYLSARDYQVEKHDEDELPNA
ncbi:MAG: M48 family metalloprotease [Planctomycetes bacterium]|nr:M48 family metalloprotease [Planctomycetota bacterium]